MEHKIKIAIGAALLAGLVGSGIQDYQETQQKQQEQQEHQQKLKEIRERQKFEREQKLAAMTEKERSTFLKDEEAKKKKAEEAAAKIKAEEAKKKKFEAEQLLYSIALKRSIIDSAFDPDSLVFKEPTYHSNGVCLKANGKNRFGGYVGFKEYCALVDKKGKWKVHQY